jgi:Rha family phage regulatory protein
MAESEVSMKLILNPEHKLYEKGGKAFCDSLQVAQTFGKRHDNVLRDIGEAACSEGFRHLNFEESTYQSDQNKKQPMYLMTKDGFTFLVMGYRGKKAATFKEAYINRFNEMEQFIKDITTAKMEYPAFTNAVMLAHDEPKHYHFSNEIDMINRIVLGVSAKQFKEAHGIDRDTASIRPWLTPDQIKAVTDLQRADIGLLVTTPDFQRSKEYLMDYFQRLQLRHLA